MLFDHSCIINHTILLNIGAAESSNIVAGGYGLGNDRKKLCFPYGVVVDDDQTMIIADWGNHRIVQWKMGENNGQVIAGGHGQGNQRNQLNCPTDLLIDKQNNSLIICDRGNNRVVRWSRNQGTTEGEILRENIACWGLAMDNQRFLYISDTKNNEVKRYSLQQIREDNGTRVAGSGGRGFRFSQLNMPTYIFVDQQQTVYVSDAWNHRVMKWVKDVKEGTVVFRGSPRGIFVDVAENVYVADYGNHQLVRWPKDCKKAEDSSRIAGGNGKGEQEDHLYYPWGLSCHQQTQFFVADHLKHRVQRFRLEQAN